MSRQRTVLGLQPIVCSGCGRRFLVPVATLLADDTQCPACDKVLPTAEQERADADLRRLLHILREEDRVKMTLPRGGIRKTRMLVA